VTLKFIEGYKNAEIAQMMNKKEGAVRALQYRALRSLQGIMEAEEERELEFAVAYMDAAAS
jgi:DNA-directed RNA polymerase specialized sigma24 family protein